LRRCSPTSIANALAAPSDEDASAPLLAKLKTSAQEQRTLETNQARLVVQNETWQYARDQRDQAEA
jgi:hypothetical protein